MQTGVTVKTDAFEGPLDLLLSLIEKRKLLINDVALEDVADEYIASLQTRAQFPTDEVAGFLVIAATLVLIKSRSLIGTVHLSDEEESRIDDLGARLAALAGVREHAAVLRRIFGERVTLARTEPVRVRETVFTPGALHAGALHSALSVVLSSLPEHHAPKNEAVVGKVVSLEEVMGGLAVMLKRELSFTFGRVVGEGPEKLDIIVHFLALLELVRVGSARVAQENYFEDIAIESTEIGVPSYV